MKNPSAFWLPDVKIVDERFAIMSKNYTEEQKDLKAEVKNLQQQIHEQEQQAENIEQFIQRVKRNRRYSTFGENKFESKFNAGICER